MALSITNITATKGTTISQYGLYELKFNLSGVTPTDYNPFRPETTSMTLPKLSGGDWSTNAGVDVYAIITLPDASTIMVNGFYDVDYEYCGYVDGKTDRDLFAPVSAPHWHIRYAPKTLGSYSAVIHLVDSTGEVTSAAQSFLVEAGSNKGSIIKAASLDRFTYQNGDPFIPIGTQCPADAGVYLEHLNNMQSQGMNYIREWIVNQDSKDIHRDLFYLWGSSQLDTYGIDDTEAHTGSRSYMGVVNSTATERMIVNQDYIACRNGSYYKASAYFKTSSLNGNAKIRIKVGYTDGSYSTYYSSTLTGTNDWTELTVTFQASSAGKTVEHMKFAPVVDSSSTTGTVWVDDCSIVETNSSYVDLGYANYLFKPGFEEWNGSELNMSRLARVDHLLATCEQYDIKAQLCIFDYRLYQDDSRLYPEYYGDFFTDTEALDNEKRVLRHIVARWGASPALMSWELANEIDDDYAAERMDWITELGSYIHSIDVHDHFVTNSYWTSPADIQLDQNTNIDLSQVHFYMNTEERVGGQGIPSWWSLDTTMTLCSDGVQLVATGSLIGRAEDFYIKPNRKFKLIFRRKGSGITGKLFVQLQFKKADGTQVGSTLTYQKSGTFDWDTVETEVTSPADVCKVNVGLLMDGSSGTGYFKYISLVDETSLEEVIFNGDFKCSNYGDDEFEWALYGAYLAGNRNAAGPSGSVKPWLSGEFGLMGANSGLSVWADPEDVTKPRHDTTGIHAKNGLWAYFMATRGVNTPTYWWVHDTLIPYNLYSCWTGIVKFSKKLPFYERGESLSSNTSFGRNLAVPSNSSIRVIGARNDNKAYMLITNKENTWSNIVRSGNTPNSKTFSVALHGWSSDTYLVNYYSTTTGDVVSSGTATPDGAGILTLSNISLSTDVAATVVPLSTTVTSGTGTNEVKTDANLVKRLLKGISFFSEASLKGGFSREFLSDAHLLSKRGMLTLISDAALKECAKLLFTTDAYLKGAVGKRKIKRHTLIPEKHFKSGIGDADDLLLSIEKDSLGKWYPKLHSGYYYIKDSEYYLFTKPESLYFRIPEAGLMTLTVSGIYPEPGSPILLTVGEKEYIRLAPSPLELKSFTPASGSVAIAGKVLKVRNSQGRLLKRVPLKSDINRVDEYALETPLNSTVSVDTLHVGCSGNIFVDYIPSTIENAMVTESCTVTKTLSGAKCITISAASPVLSGTHSAYYQTLSGSGTPTTTNGFDWIIDGADFGDTVAACYFVADSFVVTSPASGVYTLFICAEDNYGDAELTYESSGTLYFDTKELADTKIQLNPLYDSVEDGFIYLTDKKVSPSIPTSLSAVIDPNPVLITGTPETKTFAGALGFIGGEHNGTKTTTKLDLYPFEFYSGLVLADLRTTKQYIWVVNSAESTVSKLDADTGIEVARYLTGPSGQAWNPSRCAVDRDGNVWVGNRAFNGTSYQAVKILGDSFRNSIIGPTSSGSTPLNWSFVEEPQDERIALFVDAKGTADNLIRAIVVDDNRYVWMGLWGDRDESDNIVPGSNYYVKVDPDTGIVLDTVICTGANGAYHTPYGAAYDYSRNLLWSSGGYRTRTTTREDGTTVYEGRTLFKLDTTAGTGTIIDTPKVPYGICMGDDNCVYMPTFEGEVEIMRYSPDTEEFTLSTLTSAGVDLTYTKSGICIDKNGYIWRCAKADGVYSALKVDPDTLELVGIVPTSGTTGIGVGMDANGKIWVINQGSNNVTKIDPDTLEVIGVYPVGSGPYMYSDFTGQAAMNGYGSYSKTYDSGSSATAWGRITWSAVCPSGTSITVDTRAADASGDLSAAAWIYDLTNGEHFTTTGRFLQVRINLRSDVDGTTPIVRSLTLAGEDIDAFELLKPTTLAVRFTDEDNNPVDGFLAQASASGATLAVKYPTDGRTDRSGVVKFAVTPSVSLGMTEDGSVVVPITISTAINPLVFPASGAVVSVADGVTYSTSGNLSITKDTETSSQSEVYMLTKINPSALYNLSVSGGTTYSGIGFAGFAMYYNNIDGARIATTDIPLSIAFGSGGVYTSTIYIPESPSGCLYDAATPYSVSLGVLMSPETTGTTYISGITLTDAAPITGSASLYVKQSGFLSPQIYLTAVPLKAENGYDLYAHYSESGGPPKEGAYVVFSCTAGDFGDGSRNIAYGTKKVKVATNDCGVAHVKYTWNSIDKVEAYTEYGSAVPLVLTDPSGGING